MHKGKTWPYDLDLRVYMGQFNYPNFIRKGYRFTRVAGQLVGPLAPEINYANFPLDCYRQPSLEGGLDEIVLAGDLQMTSGGLIQMGFRFQLQPDQRQIVLQLALFVGGTSQYSFSSGSGGFPSQWNLFTLTPVTAISGFQLRFATGVPFTAIEY